MTEHRVVFQSGLDLNAQAVEAVSHVEYARNKPDFFPDGRSFMGRFLSAFHAAQG